MTTQPGWGFPLNSRKAHFFTAGEIISVCGRMMYSGERQDDNHNSPDNCAECRRRQAKLEKATTES
jgi:hypothetical protein